MSKIKFIHIEYRAGRNREEKQFFGRTFTDDNTAYVYININKNRKNNELVDTFFHEMAHVFFSFHSRNKQMTVNEEEKLAQQIGRVCGGVLR